MIALNLKTRGEKFLVVAWLFIPVAVFGTSIYGWAIGDVWGGVLMSFLPASLFASIAAFVAAIVDAPLARFSKKVWVAVAVLSLLAAIMFASRPSSDAIRGADTILAYVLLILSFPVALLVPFILMGTASLWPDGESILGLVGMWLAFFVAGYVQWFVLLPWLWRKWKGRCACSTTPHA